MFKAFLWGLIVLGAIWLIATVVSAMVPYVIGLFVVFVIGKSALSLITSEKPEAKNQVIDQ
jgi:Na+/alanine symporter